MNKKDYVMIYFVVSKEHMSNSKLNSTDKLLLLHITALCNKNGYCSATNNYFVSIYNLSKTSISKSINKLVRFNILKSETKNYDFNHKKRILTLIIDVWKNNYRGIGKCDNTSMESELPYNNKYQNKINNKIIDEETKELLDYDWLEDPDDWFHSDDN